MDAFKNDNVKNLQTIDFVGCYFDKNKYTGGTIYFSSGYELFLERDAYWNIEHISNRFFKKTLFDLESCDFFEKVDGYGIRLKPVNDYSISIPCYTEEGGDYTTNFKLILNRIVGVFDVNEIKSSEENESGRC